jgi:hypothetical protein
VITSNVGGSGTVGHYAWASDGYVTSRTWTVTSRQTRTSVHESTMETPMVENTGSTTYYSGSTVCAE